MWVKGMTIKSSRVKQVSPSAPSESVKLLRTIFLKSSLYNYRDQGMNESSIG